MKTTAKFIILGFFVFCMVMMAVTSLKSKHNKEYQPLKVKQEKYHHNVKPKTHYIDEDFILVEKREIGGRTHDKFRDAALIRIWLIQRKNNPSEYAQITSEVVTNGNHCGCGFVITDEMWYNRKEGDVLHFKYINRERFFIKR